MTKAAAIYQFWSSFGLPAFEENAVPSGDEKPDFPYITYSFSVGRFGQEVALSANVWHRSTSWVESNAKAEEIKQRIGEGGIPLDCDGGKIWIKLGDPIYQDRNDPNDDLIRIKYFNIIAEYNTKY